MGPHLRLLIFGNVQVIDQLLPIHIGSFDLSLSWLTIVIASAPDQPNGDEQESKKRCDESVSEFHKSLFKRKTPLPTNSGVEFMRYV